MVQSGKGRGFLSGESGEDLDTVPSAPQGAPGAGRPGSLPRERLIEEVFRLARVTRFLEACPGVFAVGLGLGEHQAEEGVEALDVAAGAGGLYGGVLPQSAGEIGVEFGGEGVRTAVRSHEEVEVAPEELVGVAAAVVLEIGHEAGDFAFELRREFGRGGGGGKPRRWRTCACSCRRTFGRWRGW